MLEKKLEKLLKEANEIRKKSIENDSANYHVDVFSELSFFISKKLNSSFLKNKNAKIIANHFDEILPFIVNSNIDILLKSANLLIEQPNFKEKFITGLKKYPYKDSIEQLFYNIWCCLNDNPDKYNDFIDIDVLKTLLTLDASKICYLDILNNLNEENQRKFLNVLVENKYDIPYSQIKYKGNNKQIIYDNLPLFIQNAQNLYSLMSFVKENPTALSQVQEYIDNNEEKTINSIFCETNYYAKITDPTLKEIIRLLVLDVMKNEHVKFSEITYSGGKFSRVLLIGNKVIKFGDRVTKNFPNNPYIIAPLLRKELKLNGESCFIEVTERVDTSEKPSHEELYQLYKNLRDLELVWTDIHDGNVGRLRKENIIHWNKELNPSEEVLELNSKRGKVTLKEGDLVILDADFIYDEKDPNICISSKGIYYQFEERYQKEKNEIKKEEAKDKSNINIFDKENIYDIGEHKGIRR